MKKNKCYNITVILMIALAGFGERIKFPYIPLPLYWLFIVLFIIYSLIKRGGKITLRFDMFSSTMIFWVLYTVLISVLYGFLGGLTPLLSLITNAVMIIVILIQDDDKLTNNVFYGVSLSCLITSVIGIIEIVTPGFHVVAFPSESYIRNFAGKAVGLQVNMNDNSTLLITSVITLIYCMLKLKKNRVITCVLCAVMTYILYVNGSRASFVAVVVCVVYYVCFKFMRSRVWKYFAVIIPLGAILLMLSSDVFDIQWLQDAGSDAARLSLIKRTFDTALQHAFLGAGAGATTTIINASPHNMLLEILADYGIPVLIPLLAVMYRIFKYPQKSAITKKDILITVFMLCFVITSISSSSMLRIRLCWIEMAFFYKQCMLCKENIELQKTNGDRLYEKQNYNLYAWRKQQPRL